MSGRTRAHPRGCGADRSSMRTTSSAHGSSPRVRGRRISNVSTNWLRRLIPAGAGQTSRSSSALMRRWAHPRGCGADSSNSSPVSIVPGSSPRVRGRLAPRAPSVRGERLIPAGAGQTRPPPAPSCPNWAHPRGCGADRHSGDGVGGHGGLIPAGAGQTSRSLVAR